MRNRLHLHLKLVEALTVNTVHIGLGGKSIGIDRLYDSRNRYRFYFSAHHQQHLHLFLGIPTHARQYGASAACFIIDCCGNFLPFGRKNSKLNRLTVSVDHHIGRRRGYQQHNIAIHNQIELVRYEI